MSTELAVVEHIFIAPQSGAPMQAVQSVRAVEGQGLEGDRYNTQEGRYSHRTDEGRTWWVSLMDMTLLGAGNDERWSRCLPLFTVAETRRNILTRGIDLTSLIGKDFLIGEAVLRGAENCHPCRVPSQLSGKDGFQDDFTGRGGIRAGVIQSGQLGVGSLIQPLESQ